MKKFYILKYSSESGDKEVVIITQEEITPEFIEDNKPYGTTFDFAIECETQSFNLESLPLDYELQRN